MVFKGSREYMKEKLKDYILFQLNQGYEPNDIKEPLINNGYSRQMVEEIFSETGSTGPARHPVRAKKEMSRDLFNYLGELLTDFILKEREQGYSYEAIKKALINYGHDSNVVDAAIESVKKGSEIEEFAPSHKPVKTGLPPSLLFSIMILGLIGVVFYLSISTGSELFIVFVSFLPSIIALCVNYFAVLQFKSRHYLELVPPLTTALAVVFFVIMMQLESPIRDISEPNVILIINALAAFIMSSVLCFFSKWPHFGEAPTEEEVIPKEKIKTKGIEGELQSSDKELEEMLKKKV
ncbi:MAG: hypothetical protein ACOCQX_04605 [Candidatus Nanoarchaeia archaeon]